MIKGKKEGQKRLQRDSLCFSHCFLWARSSLCIDGARAGLVTNDGQLSERTPTSVLLLLPRRPKGISAHSQAREEKSGGKKVWCRVQEIFVGKRQPAWLARKKRRCFADEASEAAFSR